MNNEQEYTVNMGFMDDNGRIYSSGQTISSIEYQLLPMNMKVRCSPKQEFDTPDYNFRPPVN